MTATLTAIAHSFADKARTSAALINAGYSIGAAVAVVLLSTFSPETC